MKNLITVLSIILLFQGLHAQKDSSGIRRTPQDTGRNKMNLDAVYNRPFLQAGKLPVAIGGYLEIRAISPRMVSAKVFLFNFQDLHFLCHHLSVSASNS
jgi:hypothetical protein